MKITIEIDTDTEKDAKALTEYHDFATALLKLKRPSIMTEALTSEERIKLDQASVDQFKARKALADVVDMVSK